jgi:dephospho-CoA kinase
MLIGITGQIGSGKTEVARIFRKFHARVIFADKIGHDVVEKNPAILKKLVRSFGPEILTSHGRLKRKLLGKMAFSSPAQKKKLNTIVHPPLLKELSRQVRDASKGNRLVVVDAALLIDWGWHKKVDFLIVIHSPHQLKISRFMNKGYSYQEANDRLKSQLPLVRYRHYADFVIYNNKSIAALEVQVAEIMAKIGRKKLTLPV